MKTSPSTVAGLTIGVALCGFLAACGDSPAGPGKPGTGPGVARIEIVGPPSIAPGQSAQYSAVQFMSDGTNKPATVNWTSAQPVLFQVTSTGLVTAQGSLRGESTIQVELTGTGTTGARRASREILVLPDGTYRVTGLVLEADGVNVPIHGARVEAAATPDFAVLTAFSTTGGDGRYKLYGVPADAHLRVVKDGYITLTDRMQLGAHATRNFQLPLDGERLNLAGNYTMMVEASTRCSGNQSLPADLRLRTYDAVITQNGPLLTVTLAAPQFVVGPGGLGNHFAGVVSATRVSVELRTSYDFYYYPTGPPHPDVVELLPDHTMLVVNGRATLTGTSNGLSGQLNGGLTQYRGASFPSVIFLAGCGSERLTLTRR